MISRITVQNPKLFPFTTMHLGVSLPRKSAMLVTSTQTRVEEVYLKRKNNITFNYLIANCFVEMGELFLSFRDKCRNLVTKRKHQLRNNEQSTTLRTSGLHTTTQIHISNLLDMIVQSQLLKSRYYTTHAQSRFDQ